MTIEVEKWTSIEEAEKTERRDVGTMGGWFQDGMRWKDYAEKEPMPLEYAEAIRRSVLKNQIRIDGGEHQEGDEGCPVFSDGAMALMSMRAWGDLLAAIWSEHDNADYNYMDFYYGGVSPRAQGKP